MNISVKTRLAAGLVVAVVALVGCATTAAEPEPVQWDDRQDFGVPGDMVATHSDVPFYPACGNEVLTWDETAYYAYKPSQIDDFPDPADVVTRASALANSPLPTWARMSAPVPAVAPPGPGDDRGTLVIYEGGHAYWESDNGELSTWLTTTELEYMWIC